MFETLNRKYFEGKNENIQTYLIETSLRDKSFSYTQKYLISVDKMDYVAQMFDSWTQLGAPHEKELFVIRFILMYSASHF